MNTITTLQLIMYISILIFLIILIIDVYISGLQKGILKGMKRAYKIITGKEYSDKDN